MTERVDSKAGWLMTEGVDFEIKWQFEIVDSKMDLESRAVDSKVAFKSERLDSETK